MRSSLIWGDAIVDSNGTKQPVYDIAFKPDGSQLLVACGSFVLVYDGIDGKLQHTLKTHKDAVYAVDYNADGKRFASAGADKTVIVWNSAMDPIIKYIHSDPVQCLTHNPVTGQTTSGSLSEYGLWSPDQKNVTKQKTLGRVLSLSWNSNGQLLALGMFNGYVSIRNHVGNELCRIERGSPVWAIAWRPFKDEDTLLVTDWDQRISLFSKEGTQIGDDVKLGYDPCFVDFSNNGELIAIGGSDRKVTLWTSDLVRLSAICERESWTWRAKFRPKTNQVAIAGQDGSVSLYQIAFSTVHAMYQDNYAYRYRMSQVDVSNLSTNQKCILDCHAHVKRIAIYKNLLAVQLPDSIQIFEKETSTSDLSYQLSKVIRKKLECSLLVITTKNLILCLDRRLHLLNFEGNQIREWTMNSLIRYIKVIGGITEREGLLVGLKNGEVLMVYLFNAYPIKIFKLDSSIRCLDLNQTKQKVAAVDENGNCVVYGLATQKILFQDTGASSVAWNIEHEDLLCYSGNGILATKAGDLPTHRQKMSGFVVGFKGSKVFCLNSNIMVTIDSPQSASMLSYLNDKKLDQAYKIACLGVTDADWRTLAMSSLQNFDFETAKKSLFRIKNFKLLDTIRRLQQIAQDNKDLALGELYAIQGRFEDAAEIFIKSGNSAKAIDMYSDLNMWEHAAKIADENKETKKEILKKKAQTQQDKRDVFSAANTYIEVGEYMSALAIYAQNMLYEEIASLVRKVDKMETKVLAKCIDVLRKAGKYDHAAEALRKMGNIKELVELYIHIGKWDEAKKIADEYPGMSEVIFLPYANWLAQEGQYDDSVIYFRKAGKSGLAVDVLAALAENAISETRFRDASLLYWKISREFLELVPKNIELADLDTSIQSDLQKYLHYEALAEYFFAYSAIYQFVTQPFTEYLPEHMFHMARFLFHADFHTASTNLYGLHKCISRWTIYYALGKLCRSLHANKFGRFVVERMFSSCLVSDKFYMSAKLDWLYMKSRPFVDSDDLQPICWYCGTTNALISFKKPELQQEIYREACQKCGVLFVPSLYSFENLGIIEFQPEDDIQESEAISLLMREPEMTLDEALTPNNGIEKASDKLVIEFENETSQENSTSILNGIEVVSRDHLLRFSPLDVFIVKSKWKCRKTRYYRTALPNVRVTLCIHCEKFFHVEDFELVSSKTGSCPFCKTKLEEDEEDFGN